MEYVSIYRPVLTECQEPGIDGACGEEAWLEWWTEKKMGSWEMLGEEGFRNKEVLGRAPRQEMAHKAHNCALEGRCWPWGDWELGGQESNQGGWGGGPVEGSRAWRTLFFEGAVLRGAESGHSSPQEWSIKWEGQV